jgi:hypothetical protein
MTAHELAKVLLDGEDFTVTILDGNGYWREVDAAHETTEYEEGLDPISFSSVRLECKRPLSTAK